MERLGNGKAWTAVLKHVTEESTRHSPLVVWGPTGCGKSMGVRSLLRDGLGFTLLELDGTDGETVEQLVLWVKRARQTKTMAGPTAVLLDDFESFTPTARAALGKLVKEEAAMDDENAPKKGGKRTKRGETPLARLAPLVITCTQLREPSMRGLVGLRDVRLFPPNEHVLHEWFADHYEWTTADGTARKGLSRGGAARLRDAMQTGDVRRVSMAAQWKLATRGGAVAAASFVPPTSIFDATRRLLQRRLPASEWGGEARDVALLQHHLPKYVVDEDVDALADALDVFSSADASRPARYEHVEAHLPYALLASATTARLTSRARDVGALAPPPRVERGAGLGSGNPFEDGRRAMVW